MGVSVEEDDRRVGGGYFLVVMGEKRGSLCYSLSLSLSLVFFFLIKISVQNLVDKIVYSLSQN